MIARPFVEPVVGQSVSAFVDLEVERGYWVRAVATILVPGAERPLGALGRLPVPVVASILVTNEIGEVVVLRDAQRAGLERMFLQAYDRRRSCRPYEGRGSDA